MEEQAELWRKGKHVGISCDDNGEVRAIREEPEQRERSRGFSR
jgi:hypothetical protein